jgi:hypothetical protein
MEDVGGKAQVIPTGDSDIWGIPQHVLLNNLQRLDASMTTIHGSGLVEELLASSRTQGCKQLDHGVQVCNPKSCIFLTDVLCLLCW